MTGMNLGDIVENEQKRRSADTEHFAQRLMKLLEEYVPATQKEAFMVKLSSVMSGVGDTHPLRIAIFNEVQKRLHAENQHR